jgi:hypothetical protein
MYRKLRKVYRRDHACLADFAHQKVSEYAAEIKGEGENKIRNNVLYYGFLIKEW